MAWRRRSSIAVLMIAFAALVMPAPASADHEPPGSGYVMLGLDGVVHTFGAAPWCGNASNLYDEPMFGIDIEMFPDGHGYWVLEDTDSGLAFVSGTFCEPWNPNGYYEAEPILLDDGELSVSISFTPNGTGFWVFTDRGRVIPYGDAEHFGDMSGVPLNGPVLDSVATPSGEGYYMVASDGGIFAFGDAQFHGSMGGRPLNEPVVSMAPDPDGSGYWLVASDGGVFSFDARFYGSMGGTPLNEPMMGMVASPTGSGYLMVAADGGAFTFGDVPFHGSLGGDPPAWPIWAIDVMP